MPATNILLTGQPGSGKTTLIKQVLEKADFRVGGVISNEMRRGNQRVGFTLDTLDGKRGILAHVDLDTNRKIGKYFVDVNSINTVGVTAIRQAMEQDEVVVIDEIGKMEMMSDPFREILIEALDSPKPLLGTIMKGKNKFTDAIKARPDVVVFTVNEETRYYLINEILVRLKRMLQ
ncbi:MAG TPA: NTPase [bacterium]|nr:NTPase [bacterium]